MESLSSKRSVANEQTVLVLNSGSSSLKLGLYSVCEPGIHKLVSAEAEEIGSSTGRVWIRGASSKAMDEVRNFSGMAEAAEYLVSRVFDHLRPDPESIGHRIVHGGLLLREHQRITPAVLRQLEKATAFAPLHLPGALEVIRLATLKFPGVPQVACFDTAFHKTIPTHAARLPFSLEFWDKGLRRYGFHGLSCESIVHGLGSDLLPRSIITHLGNGCSITAVQNGKSIETTMGLTPTGGVMMGTRSGDLDPGVLLYLQNVESYRLPQLESLVNHEAGLLGVSGVSSDMRQLLALTEHNEQVHLALEMFCYQVRKSFGSLAAVLGGLDLVVFTGGIGEHAAQIRAQICSGLGFLGVTLNDEANTSNETLISAAASKCKVRVFPSDEDLQIARHCRRLAGPAIGAEPPECTVEQSVKERQ